MTAPRSPGLVPGIRQLGYLGLGSTDLPSWAYLLGLVGCDVVQHDQERLLARVDDRAWRIAVTRSEDDDVAYLGWEVEDETALAALVARLAERGVRAQPATAAELAARGVRQLAWILDPEGVRLELYCGASTGEPFRSPWSASFVTGDLGLGHAVLVTQHYRETIDFYVELLGMRVTDRIVTTEGLHATFLRCNPRHHSLALVDGGAEVPQRRLHHFLLEAAQLNDVGRALDRCLDAGLPIPQSVGKHSNDLMTSFYVAGPGGVQIEYGTDGRVVDDDTWEVATHDVPSLWGHRSEDGFQIS
ncbi:MAG: VOC family protein [Nocardioidaceae bacterium]|nr:VOC family protein [Nocardioidaceae bacterium]